MKNPDSTIRSRGINESRSEDQKRLRSYYVELAKKFNSGNPTEQEQEVMREVNLANDKAQHGFPEKLEELYKVHILKQAPSDTRASSEQENDPLDPIYRGQDRFWQEKVDRLTVPPSRIVMEWGEITLDEGARELFKTMLIELRGTNLWFGKMRTGSSSTGAESRDLSQYVRGGASNLQKIEFKRMNERAIFIYIYRKNGIVSEYTIRDGMFLDDSEIIISQ